MIGKNEVAEVSYIGNDTASMFSIPFKTWNPDDLVVFMVRQSDGVRLDIQLTADYTLDYGRKELTLVSSGQEWLEGGNLKLGYTLFIQFDTEAYQPAKFTDIGGITPAKFSESMDRLTMTIKAVNDKASRALSIGAGAGDSNLPPLVGNENRILKVNSTGDGIDYGPDVQDIFDARDDAQSAAAAASGSATSASNSATAAQGSATAANTSALNAFNYAQSASTSAANALTSENNANASEQRAELWAHYYAFEEVKSVDFSASPYTISYIADDNFLILIDTSGGDVVINLPSLAGMPRADWKVAIAKSSVDANDITVTPFPGQTIKGQTSLTLDKNNIGIVFHDSTPTDWHGDVITFGSFGGGSGSGLPPGGDAGDYLEKLSNVEGDATWQSGSFSGFSAQFAREINALDIRDVIQQIARFEYLGPQVSITASGSTTIREKGSAVTAVSIGAVVTKRSNPISRIKFLRDGGEIHDMNPPSNTGSGTSYYNWTGSFTNNTTFQVQVTDEVSDEGGPTTVVANATFNFVYPYYHGVALPGRNASQVAALTKSVIASTASLTRSFTTTSGAGHVYYFAYPKAYGVLTSIKDKNGMETFATPEPAWVQREVTITGLDATPQAYYVYEFKNVMGASSASFTFTR